MNSKIKFRIFQTVSAAWNGIMPKGTINGYQ